MPFIDMEFISNPSAEMEETVLWTNPSPSADFAQQNVTLSDDINNYDYIAMDMKYLKTQPDTNIFAKVYYKVSDYKEFRLDSGSTVGVCACRYTTGTIGRRLFWYVSDTSTGIYNCFLANDTNAYNNYCIPMHIYGCKVIPKFKGIGYRKVGNVTPNISTYTEVDLGFDVKELVLYRVIGNSNSVVLHCDFENNISYITYCGGSSYYQESVVTAGATWSIGVTVIKTENGFKFIAPNSANAVRWEFLAAG